MTFSSSSTVFFLLRRSISRLSSRSIFLSICSDFWVNLFSSERTSTLSSLISFSASLRKRISSSFAWSNASFFNFSASLKAFSISFRPCSSISCCFASIKYRRTKKPASNPPANTAIPIASCVIFTKNLLYEINYVRNINA